MTVLPEDACDDIAESLRQNLNRCATTPTFTLSREDIADIAAAFTAVGAVIRSFRSAPSKPPPRFAERVKKMGSK